MTQLGENISKLMKEKSIDREALSQKAGLSKYTIRNILLGQTKKTSFENVKSLAEAFGVSADYLLTGDTRPNTSRPDFVIQNNWDGVLYAQAMQLVEKICRDKIEGFDITNKETRLRMSKYAEKVYLYSKRLGKSEVDVIFAETIIE